MEALEAMYSKNLKKDKLSERRKKLGKLLLNEQQELEVSVKIDFQLAVIDKKL